MVAGSIPTDGSWRAIADALPNSAPQTFRLPGRNAAKERDWVLVVDAAVQARAHGSPR